VSESGPAAIVLLPAGADNKAIGMEHALVEWDDAGDTDGNTAHIGEHGLTPEEVESVLRDPNASHDVSGSTGRPVAFGMTDTGRFIAVVYEVLSPDDPLIVRPITAYDVPEPS
jgi:uncharacterized DUF497 family protein